MEKKNILKTRARENAKTDKTNGAAIVKPVPLLKFNLQNRSYSIELSFLSEVCYIKEITPIPGSSSFVSGVVNLRGKIIPAISLKNLFNLEDRGLSEQNRLIVLENNENPFGIICDSIGDISEMDLSTLEPTPGNLPDQLTKYISGIFPDNTLHTNAQALTTSSEITIKK